MVDKEGIKPSTLECQNQCVPVSTTRPSWGDVRELNPRVEFHRLAPKESHSANATVKLEPPDGFEPPTAGYKPAVLLS